MAIHSRQAVSVMNLRRAAGLTPHSCGFSRRAQSPIHVRHGEYPPKKLDAKGHIWPNSLASLGICPYLPKCNE
jgi:hypothetical protein